MGADLATASPVATAPMVTPVTRRPAPRARGSWPLTMLLGGFPLLWVAGLGSFAVPLAAVPMGWHLLSQRSVRVPRGSGTWFLFLAWMALSAIQLTQVAPGTRSQPVFGALLVFVYRAACQVGAFVVFLYVVNLPAAIDPVRRVVHGLAALFCITVVGGYLGLILRDLSFVSPVEALLPHSLSSNGFLRDLVHPGFSQVQSVVGDADVRPKAPFEYTNEWGGNLALLLPAAVLALRTVRGAARSALIALLVVAPVPALLSLNRGLWLSAILYGSLAVAWAIANRGRAALRGMVAAVLVLIVILVATPLGGTVGDRSSSGHSDGRREFLAERALAGAAASPLLGWGAPRTPIGSERSIAAGQTAGCELCGGAPIGTHGHLYYLAFSHGWVGAALCAAFFAGVLARCRPLADPVVATAAATIAVFALQWFFYNLVPTGLVVAMLAAALVELRRVARSGALPPAVGVRTC